MENRGPYHIREQLSGEQPGLLAQVHDTRSSDSTALLLKTLPEVPSESWKQALELIRHTRCPHLRVPLEVDVDSEGPYLVARWLPGPSLEEARQERFQGKVPVRQALLWLRHCLLALEVLHYHGLLHGDVKPSNLLLDHEDRAVLVDLDCLHPLGEDRSDRGTPAYLTPRAEDRKSVQRDLFAAALTFAALVSGKLVPVDSAQAYRLSQHDPLIPEATDQILLRCQSAQDQYESAGDMLETVDKLLGRAPEAKPTTTSPPTRRVNSPQKKKSSLLVPLCLLSLCYPLGYLTAWLWKPAPLGPPPSVSERSGIESVLSSYQNRKVWTPTILDRPVALFLGSDSAEGGETAQQRSRWVQAVLQEAYFQDRPLEFEFRAELPDSCEVWLVSEPGSEKFLMRVTKSESELLDTPAPALARLWTGLMQDTFTLLGFPARPDQAQGVLLLRPWRNRVETLTGGETPSTGDRVGLYKEALRSLKDEVRDKILDTYLPDTDDKEQDE